MVRTGSDLCPVAWLEHYLSVRPKIPGPLFCHFDGNPLTRYQFSAILKKSLHVFNPQLAGYKSHSFRIGAATAAANKGFSVEQIKEAGRWSSDAYKTYIQSGKDFKDMLLLQ